MSENTQPLNYHTFKAWRFDQIAAEVDREVAVEMGTPRPRKPREPNWETPVVDGSDTGYSGGPDRVPNARRMELMWAARQRAYDKRRNARGNLDNRQVCEIRKAIAKADFSMTEIRRQARKYGVTQAVVKELLTSWRNSPQWDPDVSRET